MPTKTRAAAKHVGDAQVSLSTSALSTETDHAAAPVIRPARDALKAVAGEAKRKSSGVETSSAPCGAEGKVAVEVRRSASKEGVEVRAAKSTAKGQADGARIDPAAARKAAAAFVAARKKMVPATSPAPSPNSNDAAKGTVEVTEKKDRMTTSEEAAIPSVTAPAPVPQASQTPSPAVAARPFSTVGRGHAAAVKPRPASSAKGQSFKTGEFIVYPAHGVGQITAIETQEVAGYKLELFVISFVKDKMILKVPLPKIASVGMRKLAEPPVVKRALETLTGRARIKRTMWSRRAQEYEAKINSGDLIAIAEVVRDLYRSDAQPEQSYSERQLYEAALDRMGRELGVLQKLTDTEALKLIDDQLQKGPRRGKAEDAESEEGDDADADESGIGEAA